MSLRSDFDKIIEQYDELNTSYSKEELLAINGDDLTSYKKWSDKRQLNDAIHFLFIFTRFEDFVRNKSSELIRTESQAPNHLQKRSWVILKDYDKDDNLHLMKRIQLFIPKESQNFQKIKDYYDNRNKLAHGGDYNIPIDIAEMKNDLLKISDLF